MSKSVLLRLSTQTLLLAVLLLTLSPATGKAKSPPAMREIDFPAEFSCGKLYSYTPALEYQWLPSSADVKRQGKFVGEARGKVIVRKGEQTYLFASYDLANHPDCLKRLKPADISCLNMGSMGSIMDIGASIDPVASLYGLKRLEIDAAELTDAQVSKLRTLINLEALSLSTCSLQGTCLEKMTTMTKLKELNLANNLLDPRAYSYLSLYPALVRLDLSHCGTTDAALLPLMKLTMLKELLIGRSHITAKGLKTLTKFKNLKELNLGRTSLTVQDICNLRGSKLTKLFLPDSRYSHSDWVRLKEALPSTRFDLDREPIKMEPDKLFAPLH